MNDKHPEETPKAKQPVIEVVFSEHRGVITRTESGRPLAVVPIDPLQSHCAHDMFSLRDLPPLFITLSYTAETGTLALLIAQSDQDLTTRRDLLSFTSQRPASTYVFLELSQEASLSILVRRDGKTL